MSDPADDERYRQQAEQAVDHVLRRYGPDSPTPDPDRCRPEKLAELRDGVYREARLVGEIARAVNRIDGLSAHTGAGDSPGSRACHIQRDRDPEDDGFRQYGVRQEFLWIGDVDGLGFQWWRLDDDPAEPLTSGLIHAGSAPVTAERFHDDPLLADQVLELVTELAGAFLTGDRRRFSARVG